MPPSDQNLLDLTLQTDCYEELDDTEKGKVNKALAGKPASTPRSNIGKVAFYLARRLHPLPPPDQPDPAVKKVAPRVAYKDGGSDARFCTDGLPRMNQPGHAWDGRLYDDVASYDDNGLCWGGRSDGPAVTSAREINGRPYCSLPTMGDPTKQTGSWAI